MRRGSEPKLANIKIDAFCISPCADVMNFQFAFVSNRIMHWINLAVCIFNCPLAVLSDACIFRWEIFCILHFVFAVVLVLLWHNREQQQLQVVPVVGRQLAMRQAHSGVRGICICPCIGICICGHTCTCSSSCTCSRTSHWDVKTLISWWLRWQWPWWYWQKIYAANKKLIKAQLWSLRIQHVAQTFRILRSNNETWGRTLIHTVP